MSQQPVSSATHAHLIDETHLSQSRDPRVSIVVAHLCDASLERTLLSVLENRSDDCEIVVIHHHYHDPYELGDEVRFVRVGSHNLTLGHQFALGLRECDAPIVNWIYPGVTVTKNWFEEPIKLMEDPYIGSVSTVIKQNDTGSTKDVCGLQQTFTFDRKEISQADAKKTGMLGPTKWCAFYRKAALQQIDQKFRFGHGNFDLEYAMALKMIGFECQMATQSLAEIDLGNVAEVSEFKLGRERQQLLWRHATMNGSFQATVATAAAIFGETIGAISSPHKLLSVAGRLTSMLSSAGKKKFQHSLKVADGPDLFQYHELLKMPHREETSRRAA